MSCGDFPLGGCANPDLGHMGKCTPWSGVCIECGPVVGECPHSFDWTSRTKLGLYETRALIGGTS